MKIFRKDYGEKTLWCFGFVGAVMGQAYDLVMNEDLGCVEGNNKLQIGSAELVLKCKSNVLLIGITQGLGKISSSFRAHKLSPLFNVVQVRDGDAESFGKSCHTHLFGQTSAFDQSGKTHRLANELIHKFHCGAFTTFLFGSLSSHVC